MTTNYYTLYVHVIRIAQSIGYSDMIQLVLQNEIPNITPSLQVMVYTVNSRTVIADYKNY